MATRRVSAPALQDGATFTCPQPDRPVLLGRTPLYQRPRTNTFTVSSGVPVLNSTTADPRPPLRVGSLAVLQQPRGCRAVQHSFPDTRAWTGFQTPRLVRVTALPDSPRSSAVQVTDMVAVKTQGYRALAVIHPQTGLRPKWGMELARTTWPPEPEPPTPTAKELAAVISPSSIKFAANKLHLKLIDFDDLEPEFLDAIKRAYRKQEVAAMYDRLNTNIDREWRFSSIGNRPATVARTQENFRLNGDKIAKMVRELRAVPPKEIKVLSSDERVKLFALWSLCGSAPNNTHGTFTRALRGTAYEEVRKQDCGHFDFGGVSLSDGSSRVQYCHQCATGAFEITTREGTTELVVRGTYTHTWTDGTRRTYREPAVVGQRHSGKSVVGKVEPLAPNPCSTRYLTLGLELEMQAVNGDPDFMARTLRTELTQSNLLDSRALGKYLHFEHDGSTGPGGFEMVTGYTDLATHAKLLKAMFVGSDGAPNPWAGQLRSHNAQNGSCGIHVHIAKPKSLVHNMKIHQFVNSAANAKLVKDVARRYGDSWCKMRPHGEAAPKAAAMAYKVTKQLRYDKPGAVKLACDRINMNDRYEALNFQNSATVEFRIFRGTTVYVSMMACLEFAQAVHDFTKVTVAQNLNTEQFIAFVNGEGNRANTRNLRMYLSKWGYKMVLPKVKHSGPTTTSAQAEPLACAETV